jgi:hypothetical protein
MGNTSMLGTEGHRACYVIRVMAGIARSCLIHPLTGTHGCRGTLPATARLITPLWVNEPLRFAFHGCMARGSQRDARLTASGFTVRLFPRQ